MKKILFVGKFNDIIKDSHCFDELFEIQICVASAKMVKGMLRIKHPDLVVISLAGISTGVNEIFEELKNNYSELPVICIGTNQEVKVWLNNNNSRNMLTLIAPIDDKRILDTICNVLGTKGNDGKDDKKSILLVDDSNIQLRTLNDLLKNKYEVRMATSGMQALTLIGKKKPDMIFLDYEMPVCDGRMTLEMIRELEEAKNIPVVFLTGVSSQEHIKAVLKLNPAGYILKPADADRIYSIIEEVLGK